MLLHDALLAYVHFVFAFLLFAALAGEAWVLRLPVTPDVRKLLLRIDMIYGLSAAGVVIAGLLRVFWGAKGPDYYWADHFFWAKMLAFAIVGVISILPTMAFFNWRKAAAVNPAFAPDEAEVKKLRRLVSLELIFLALVPLFAALMARGLGAV
jgi:putative membrane protein